MRQYSYEGASDRPVELGAWRRWPKIRLLIYFALQSQINDDTNLTNGTLSVSLKIIFMVGD